MELADAGVLVLLQPLLEVGGHRLVAEPGARVAARAVGAQLRDDEIGGLGLQALLAVVAGGGDQSAAHARLLQDGDRVLRRQHVPGVVAVVHVRVEHRQLGAGCGERCGHGERGDELTHARPPAWQAG
jgi:hypothetical protein